jgi:hypothetical protein
MIEGKLDAAIDFWMKEIGVDEVITRKFLSWDDNTTISLGKALDPHLYETCRPSAKSRASGHSNASTSIPLAGSRCAARTCRFVRRSSFPT